MATFIHVQGQKIKEKASILLTWTSENRWIRFIARINNVYLKPYLYLILKFIQTIIFFNVDTTATVIPHNKSLSACFEVAYCHKGKLLQKITTWSKARGDFFTIYTRHLTLALIIIFNIGAIPKLYQYGGSTEHSRDIPLICQNKQLDLEGTLIFLSTSDAIALVKIIYVRIKL